MRIHLPIPLRRMLAPILFFAISALGLFALLQFAVRSEIVMGGCRQYTVNDLDRYRTDMLARGADPDTVERIITTTRRYSMNAITSCGQKGFLGIVWGYGLAPGSISFFVVLALGIVLLCLANWATNAIDELAHAGFFDHLRQSVFWYATIGLGIWFLLTRTKEWDGSDAGRLFLMIAQLAIFPFSNIVYLVIRSIRRRTALRTEDALLRS